MTNNPLVSIIIVNWNGGQIFKDCLSSLEEIAYKNCELIVVDNGSTDGSDNFRAKNIKTVTIKNRDNLGFAPANNQGVKKTSGKYVLLLNNDTKVSKNFLNILVSKMESDKTIGVLQPKIFMMDKPGYLDNAGSYFTKIGFLEHWGFGQKDSPEFGKEKEIFSAKGACMLIRKSVVDKLGLFDDYFVSYFEESDFCWRVWLAGWRVLFFPEAKIKHKVGFTIKRLDVGNINFHYYKNRIISLIKNLSFPNLLYILPLHLVFSVGISIAFLLKGQLKSAKMIAKAVFWNLTNITNTLKNRTIVQKLRAVSDQQVFTNLSKPTNIRKFILDFKRVSDDLRKK